MDKIKAGYLEGTVSIVVNAGLFAVKMWVALITGSAALAADAWHTLSDSLTSIIVVAATKFSSRKADKEHPFGHGRWEQLAALFIAMFLGIIAFDFLRESINILRGEHTEPVQYGTLAIVVTVISIIVKEGMAQWSHYLGKKYDNASLIADAWHHRSDALSSIPVLIGIILAKYFQIWWMDGVLTIIVALMLFYVTFQIMKESINKILGEVPSQTLINSIKTEIAQIYPQNLELHHFHIHNYGMHKELTFHIRMDGEKNIKTGHETASKIEDMIEKKFAVSTTIHVEPLKTTKSAYKGE